MLFFLKNPVFPKLFFIFLAGFFVGCNPSQKDATTENFSGITKDGNIKYRTVSDEFKEYWFSGEAEITSYQLTQERYGELRQGTAVNIFVTEDFLPEAQVKSDTISDKNISVLKLNSTKNFNTGIYPYSIMSSAFSPISIIDHPLKVSTSVQEWCGQAYLQLNNRKDFEIVSHSYFAGEADQNFSIPKTWLENELWTLVRSNPEELPTGDIMMIPSFEYSRLRHKPIEAHAAFASLKQGDCMTIYTLNYPNLQRQLILYFKSSFPYEIEKWEETNAPHPNDTLNLKTTAIKMKTIRSAYWTKNSNEHGSLRDSLNLN